MKTYQVTVDGQVYEVTVEEVTRTTSGGITPSVPPPPPTPPTAPTTAPQTIPKPAPATTPAPAPAPPQTSEAGGTSIQAPMPGKILTVNVAQGDRVKNGDVLLILEAMKMENDIIATADGTVVSINAHTGDSVNTGDVLVVIE
jgi:glutaconyl-CoA decarboxylase